MLGVLLQRPPAARLEAVNDLDQRISNWWGVVRDRNNELTARLHATPYDEHLYHSIYAADWSSKDEVWRAWATTIILWQSYAAKQGGGGFSRKFQRNVTSPDTIAGTIARLRDRMINVAIYNLDALQFLERTAPIKTAVVYCDPPYYTADNAAGYHHNDLDVAGFKAALLEQQGRVLVSGYPGEYDDLGWHHADYRRKVNVNHADHVARTERIWANYPLHRYDQLFTTTS